MKCPKCDCEITLDSKRVRDVLDNFDFKKVEKTMKALKWTWKNNKTSPTMIELRNEAERLLNKLINLDDCDRIKCGGFIAIKNGKYFELLFCVSDFSSEYMEI